MLRRADLLRRERLTKPEKQRPPVLAAMRKD
jgi:hypothetical protein